ncbi:polysaccharide biosynthesis protein [Candidatus Thioglobus sp.]|nr:polysaccharide biosynthesis protein [Candidatus Thioglobus sp.]
MIIKILELSRFYKQLIILVVDSIVIILLLILAFSLRLGYLYLPEGNLFMTIIGAPIIAIPIFIYFGLYKAIIRHIELKAIWDIVKAVFLYSLIWSMAAFILAIEGIPRSVVLINFSLCLIVIIGSRLIAQYIFKGSFIINTDQKRALIYGAGDAGIQLVSSLEQSKSFHPIGFLDDSPKLQGQLIRGLNVYSFDDIEKIIKKLTVDEILVAMPSLPRNTRLKIINKIESFPVKVRILPGLAELAEGEVKFSDLREISLNDLLGREPVIPNSKLLGQNITGKSVLVTGAGGSIGSELSSQIISLNPKYLILYELNEHALYQIQYELSKVSNNKKSIFPILGSVNDKNRMSHVIKNFKVDTIYHAAAYKHVPMVELNNTAGVENNIFGTLNCAQVAIDEKVKTFVLISSDKAVRPSNTMGATKRVAELILQAFSVRQNITRFILVRFGNVLGSSGSVIPLFKQQIKDGGPLTVTDKRVVRYFMTIKEAVELVIQSGSIGEGGDVFVLNMGEAVQIIDLAKKMIRLSGLEVKDDSNPSGDIEIEYTGLRPGEKLFEELLIGDNVSETEHPLIMRAEEAMLEWDELKLILEKLEISVRNYNYDEIRKLLIVAVPGFKPKSKVQDLLYQKMKT